MRMRTAAAVLACLILAGCGLTGAAGSTTTVTGAATSASKGFDTPEAAIGAFVDQLKDGNTLGALDTFATEEILSRYNQTAAVGRAGALVGSELLLPGTGAATAVVNRQMLRGRHATQVLYLMSSLLDADVNLAVTAPDTDGSVYARWSRQVTLTGLSSLTITAPVAVPREALRQDPAYRRTMADEQKIFGADELAERVWLYQVGGATYLGAARLVRYGTSWKILGLGSTFADLPGTGAARPGTQEDIDAALGA